MHSVQKVPTVRRDDDIYQYRGVEVEKGSGEYKFAYVNGIIRYNEGKKYVTSVAFAIKTTAVGDNELQFLFPKEYVYSPDRAMFSVREPLDSLSSLETNFKKNVFLKLGSIVVKLPRKYAFNGEVNSKYSEKSIYTNFKRLLGEYKWNDDEYWWRGQKEEQTEVRKANTFAFEVNGKKYPLKVEVYPYRNGSKVNYSTTFEYVIDSTGKTSVTPAQVKQLHDQVAKIVND
ncbi:MAG: hypothetical protein LBO72_04115 [Helicobacteraceae bacterium]|jgi:hypothetical protein|nr:hypothetical protein [Helicobacteraceae bacterium]